MTRVRSVDDLVRELTLWIQRSGWVRNEETARAEAEAFANAWVGRSAPAAARGVAALTEYLTCSSCGDPEIEHEAVILCLSCAQGAEWTANARLTPEQKLHRDDPGRDAVG
jgi:hypothetical protein